MKLRDHELLIEAVGLLVIAAVVLWAALSGAQPALNLNGEPLTALRCDGGVVCARRGTVAYVYGSGSSGGSGGGGSSDFDGGYNVVQDEGVSLTKRTTIDFTGSGVTCTDTGSKTQCTISGGGSGGTSPYVLSFGGF